MNKKDILKQVKATAGQFMEKTGSTNILEFITWLDCTYEYSEFIDEQHRKVRK